MRPLNFLRQLSEKNRTVRVNQRLGAVLAFVAGAVNAGLQQRLLLELSRIRFLTPSCTSESS